MHSESEIAAILVDAIREALSARTTAIVSELGRQIARAGSTSQLGTEAESVVAYAEANGGLALPASDENPGDTAEHLIEAGIEMAATMKAASESWLVLVGSASDWIPYTDAEIAFLERTVAISAAALRNAAYADQLRRRERYDTMGRIGSGWVHEVRRRAQSIEQYAYSLTTSADAHTDLRVTGCRIERTAADIVDAVNRLARLSSDGMMKQTTLPVDEVVTSAAESALIMHPDITIKAELAKGLPWLRGGEDLRLALLNLLDNGALATGGHGTLTITASEDRGQVRIEITDDGHGIKSGDMVRIWEPGWSTRGSGSGCGLTASREAIERIGGKVRIESVVGQGTIARISVPACPPDIYQSTISPSA
jgi:signal transduction histidine kinase